MASSCIGIKVKFGETLCRLSASVDDDKKLDLDIVNLKEKIRSLFGFGSDGEFTMTYVDEDGDVVTLATDDDLHDIVRQSLNPLKITVKLNNVNLGGISNGPHGLLRPLDILRDQQLQQQQQQQLLQYQNLNSGVNYTPIQSQPQFLPPAPKPPQPQQQQLPYRTVNSGVSGNLKPLPGPAELLQKAAYLTQIAASLIGAMVQSPAPTPIGGASSVDGQQVLNAESSTFGTLRFP